MREAASSSTLRPWQFFALIGLVCASGTVFVLRVTAVSDVVLTCLAIAGAAVVGATVYGTLRPLVSSEQPATAIVGGRMRDALEHEKYLALRSIKDLEFDHAMGKIADADYEEIVTRLRLRAVRLLKQLDASESGYRDLIERELASRLAAAPSEPQPPVQASVPSALACPACGTVRDEGARFCKQCGTRLLALILTMLCLAAPGRAQGPMQAQVPDLKQMSGLPRVVDNLPDGTISVRLVRGQLSNNIIGQPVDLHMGGRVQTAKTDETGRAEFRGITPGTAVTIVAIVNQERLESQAFTVPEKGGVRLLLAASAPGAAGQAAAPAQKGGVAFGGDTRIIVDFGEDGLLVYYLLDIVNRGSVPVESSAPVVLETPSGAQGTSLLEDSSRQAVVSGRRVTFAGPFQPGHTAVNISYEIPYSGSTLDIAQPMPVPLENPTVMLRKVGSVNLTSPQLSGRQDGQFGGRAYIVCVGPPVVEGATLRVSLTGLPHYSRVPWIVTFALSGLAFGGGMWAAFRARPGGGSAEHLRQLKVRRAKAFGDLQRIEEQRRAGTIDASRYAARRAALVAQLEQIYGELDAEGGDEGLAA
jgi:hypothetical protein